MFDDRGIMLRSNVGEDKPSGELRSPFFANKIKCDVSLNSVV